VPQEPVLRGRLTWLRPAEREDLPRFVEWFSDLRLTRHISARAPIGLAEEEHWFEQVVEGQGKTRWFFVICRLGDRRPVGNCGLFEIDLRHGGAGIGISIGEATDRSQGLGTDALETLLDFGFGMLRLERMWLDVYATNPRARRSYEKAGFVLEATFRRAYYREGAFVDGLRMAILRSEWLDRRAREPFRPALADG
jgi:RimJ/RimL family protein N-acetyltransferase